MGVDAPSSRQTTAGTGGDPVPVRTVEPCDTGRSGQASDATALGEPLRGDFPIFERRIHGHRLTYLDSAASSQRPAAVLAAMDDIYTVHYANVHRGAYTLSEETSAAYEGARATVASFVGGAGPDEIVFVRGATEAINLVSNAWGSPNLGADDAILITEMEHHANIVPWQMLAERSGAQLRWVSVRAGTGSDGLDGGSSAGEGVGEGDGALDLDDLERQLDGRVKLVAITHVSNVLGIENPIREIAQMAHAVGAKVLLDAAQSAPHIPLDLGRLDVDFAVFSGHKMLGPTGIGALWARAETLEAMPPWQFGGGMIQAVTRQGSTWERSPLKHEAGTPPIAEAVGLGAAVSYLQDLGMARVAEHDRRLIARARSRLSGIRGIRLLGPAQGQVAALPFSLRGVHPHDLATILDGHGVAVRAGHHCAMPLHARLGLPATARASFYVYNDDDDIEALGEALEDARTIFGV